MVTKLGKGYSVIRLLFSKSSRLSNHGSRESIRNSFAMYPTKSTLCSGIFQWRRRGEGKLQGFANLVNLL